MRSAVAVFTLAILFGLAGCAGPAAVPEDSYYRLAQPAPETRLERPLLEGGLAIAVVDTPALYQDRAIVYRTRATPLQLRRHHYHYWSDAPARLLQQYLVEYFDRAGLADRVRAEDYASEARYRLQVRLLRLDRIEAPGAGGVEVALAFDLRDSTTGQRLLTGKIDQRESAGGDASMHASVQQFESALARVAHTWLQRVADARP